MALLSKHINMVLEQAFVEPQDIGKSKDSNTTKTHTAIENSGKNIELCLSAENINDSIMATDIIGELENTEFVVADKSYDSNLYRSLTSASGTSPAIPGKIN